MLLAADAAPAAAPPARPLRRLRRAGAARRRVPARRRRAPRRATRRRLELAGRSLKGQLKQADRVGARYVAILGDEGTSLQGHGERASSATVGAPTRSSHRACAEARAVSAAARQRATATPGAASSTRRARRRDGARRRLGAPPPRPRRADLHRPARPLGHRAARLPPRDARPRRSRSPSGCAPSTSSRAAGRGRRGARRATSTRTSPTGEIELDVADARRARRVRRRRRSRSTRTAPVDEMLRLRHRVLDLRRERRCATR